MLVVPPDQPPGHNLGALSAWHRARGGVTLLLDQSGWTGTAAVDRSLVTVTDDDWTLARLHALAPPQAITLEPATPIKTVWLDRDGTLIEERDYLSDPDLVRLLPGAADGLRLMASHGARLVVVSNQSGVGQGRITPEQLVRVTERVTSLLALEGVRLDGVYYCPHRSDAGCDCRKPRTGLVQAATRELGLPTGDAIVAGDKASDIALAKGLNYPAFLVTTGYGRDTLAGKTVRPDFVVDSLAELARVLCHPGGLPRAVPLPPL